MAQGQSNLNIGITATTQQAREEIGKLQSSLREFRAEQRRLADDMRKSGGGSPQQQAQYTAATRGILTTEAALRRLTAEQRIHTGVTNRESESIDKLALHFGHLAHAIGLPIEGIKALKFGLGALVTGEVIRAIAGGVKQLNDLNNAVRAIPGGKAAELKSLQQAVKETGQEAEIATRAYTQSRKLAEEAHLRDIGGRSGTSGVNVLVGGRGQQGQTIQELQMIARGGREAPPLDWTDPFYTITGRKRSRDTVKDNIDVAKSILGIKDAALQNLATMKYYNVTFAQYEEVLKRTAAGTLPVQKPATEENKKLLADYNERLDKGQEKIEETEQAVALGAVKAAKESADAFVEMGPKITEAATLPLNNIKQAWTEADLPAFFRRIGKESADSFNQQMSTAGANLPSWMKSVGAAIAGGTTAAGEAAAGQAAGGYIRGPGTGTSDSILARLSNGEFVMNAGSVRRWGVGLMHSLNNSFASGGLVNVPGFAAGGMTGTPVHLHLGGQVFATSASQSVASALVSEAHRQAMTSAGVKPSWFGGRPGGR
jgi:hypothetical protein